MVKIAEYIWIDAYGKLRSKARTLSDDVTNDKLPQWNFDGSSTGQAVGTDSEIILIPQMACPDPFRGETDILVICDCYDRYMNSIPTNTRHNAEKIFELVKAEKPWFGLEQEYVLYSINGRPLGWPESGNPEAQGKYYCGVGTGKAFGRTIVEEHYEKCLFAGLSISGINGEVMPGQWEYQVGPCEGISAGDHMWLARYILERICEKHNVIVDIRPKPEKGDWNGSGCHVNFSTETMRQPGGLKEIYSAINKLSSKHIEHLKVYGDNAERLTGIHETSSVHKFSHGVADRTASIRIPLLVERAGYGYFEDRRPASDCDPYLVTAKIAETTLL